MNPPAGLMFRHVIRVGAALLAARAAAAAAAGPYSGANWTLLDEPKVMAEAGRIDLARYPDCEEAIVDQKTVDVIRADGTAESQVEEFKKVLTERGRRDNTTTTSRYMEPYEEVSVVRVEVIRPDGSVVPVDLAANEKRSIDAAMMGMNIYDPNVKIVKVNIPGLEIGDTIHSVIRTSTVRPFIPGAFADYEMFEGDGFIDHSRVEIHLPQSKPLAHIVLSHRIPGTVTASTRTSDGETTYVWEANRVPRMFPEPAMPPEIEVLQHLAVSTVPDWRDISRWYWNLSKPHLDAVTPEMRQSVADLTAGAATDREKIEAIFHSVSEDIRYMGVVLEKDRPGFEPHDVSLTFNRKYGVCRDKAALLVSLLRVAGFKAYPVLISVGWKLDAQVPAPFFDHAIVAVEMKKGDYLLMDPTDEHTRNLLPLYDCDQSYLVCRPEGEDLRISPVPSPDKNLLRIWTKGVLSADGSVKASSQILFGGVNDDIFRGAFAQMKPDDRRRFFERALQAAIPGARLGSLQIMPDDMLNTMIPLAARMSFTAEGMAVLGRDKAEVSAPWIGKYLGVVNYVLGNAGLEKRKYPMKTYYPCGLTETISLKLAPAYVKAISVPDSSPVDDDAMVYQRQMEVAGGVLHCSKVLKLKIVEFSPAQYLKLKQTLKNADYDDRKGLIFATVPGPAEAAPAAAPAAGPAVASDSRVISGDWSLTATDAHDAVLRVKLVKKILTYAGKKREAELRIPYNPSTERVRLIGAVTISPEGKRQAVSKDELNTMDAAWDSSAKRYTGGRILVANLPGVEIGSTIEVEYEITMEGKPFVAGFEPFQSHDAIDRETYAITAPASLNIRIGNFGNPGLSTVQTGAEGSNRVETWRVSNLEPLPNEPQLPPQWAFNSGFAFFTGDAAAYIRQVNAAFGVRSSHGAKAGELARRLAEGAPSRIEALRIIRNHVATAIRLAGPDFFDLPLAELSDADTTLADGYGHLADRAILLHSMLTAVGFHPEFVLASNLPDVPAVARFGTSFPLPTEFTYPLVKVSVGGQVYYLNDTDEYGRLGTTPHESRLALDLRDGRYETIQPAPQCRTGMGTSYVMSVADNGDARIRVRHLYYGTRFNQQNRYISELPPEEKRRHFQQMVSALVQGARPIGGLTTRFDTYPGVEEFTVAVDRYGVADHGYFDLALPSGGPLFPPRQDRRTLPMLLTRDVDMKFHYEVQLPASYRQIDIMPGDENSVQPDGAGTISVETRQAGGRFTADYDLEGRPALVPPADFAALHHSESAFDNRATRVILLEETAPPPSESQAPSPATPASHPG